jgi:hypothetical protein|nr:serine O-acetyltransferase [uncultured Lachnoanaerobaculum sp.]
MKLKKENPGLAIKIYRIERWFYNHKIKFLAKIFYRVNFILCNCSIPPTTKIGRGVTIPHSIGVVIHQWSEIGDNTTIYQNVTIGNSNGPKIGKNCIIGSGACVLGDIVIGDNCNIGANAVVLTDIPCNTTAVGIPARLIKHEK